MKKIILIVQIFFLLPIIFFIILISPFRTVKIAKVKSKLLGSLAISLEIYLSEKKNGNYKNDIFVWYTDKIISNKFIFKKRKEDIFFLPGIILYPLHIFFSKIQFFEKNIYYKLKTNEKDKSKKIIYEKLKDTQNLLNKYEPFIKFNQKEIYEGDKFLEKNCIRKNDKFVCFASRESFFRNEKINSVRNSNINNKISAMKFIINNNFKTIRVGRRTKDEIDFKNDNFFDYSKSEFQKDFLDLYIISKCNFMVSDDTGINELATIMRKPKLILNFVHFKNIKNLNDDFAPIILPKKILCKDTNKILSFKEIFEKKLFDVNTIEEIPNKYELVENTPNEILESVKEMYDYTQTKKINFPDCNKEQFEFWEMNKSFFNHKPEKIIISPHFFKNNKELFVTT